MLYTLMIKSRESHQTRDDKISSVIAYPTAHIAPIVVRENCMFVNVCVLSVRSHYKVIHVT